MDDFEQEIILDVTPLAAQRFAHAVGDLNPIYFDEEAARAAGYAGRVAPPNFLSSLHSWGAGPLEADLRTDGVDASRFPGPISRDAALMGGGQELDFIRPILLGERLTVRRRMIESYQRDTRAGRLTFVVVETRYTDQAGEPVMVARDTIIAR